MPSDELWRKLLEPAALKRGWHLTRTDSRADFAQDFLSVETFAYNLDANIREISRRLATSTYQPSPLLRIDVPKGTLAVRPGSVPALNDRIILYSIVVLIAGHIDEKYPEGVYSYRVKKDGDTKHSLFKETDVLDLPFLKKKTIVARVDPFEPWYGAWPEFDKVTRRAFEIEGYRYLSVTDIAAYFENIQLTILRDQLLRYFHDDHKIINLMIGILESWTIKPDSGRAPLRGIPQGTSISSFLGNMFLLPVDYHFASFCDRYDAKYFRYMDDVRIFSKEFEVARRVIFEMDHVLRKLHLNIQSAKTRILDETKSEISHALIDSRIDELNKLCDAVKDDRKAHQLSPEKREKYLNSLDRIFRKEPDSLNTESKLFGARKPLSNLSLRAFRRWITAHSLLNSNVYTTRLISEIQKNPDHRLTRRLVSTTQQFPRKIGVATDIMKFIQSDLNIFSHQEAELLHSLRYLSRLGGDIGDYCVARLLDESANFYIRIQACHLLARTVLQLRNLMQFQKLFDREKDVYVQAALPIILGQFRGDNNTRIVRKMVFHSNPRVVNLGRFVASVKNDKERATKFLGFVFEKNREMRLCDYVPFLFFMSQSKNDEIVEATLRKTQTLKESHPVTEMRRTLQHIRYECLKNLGRVS